jgi:ketosteroid isomerase-like protein
MRTEQSKQVVEDFLEAFSRGDVDAVVAGLDDDAQWWVLGSVENLSGSYTKQQMAELLPSFTELYKAGALVITPSGMVAEGDKVAVEAEGFAELTNGRVYNSKYHFLFLLDGEKVKEVKEYLDTQHAHSIFFT